VSQAMTKDNISAANGNLPGSKRHLKLLSVIVPCRNEEAVLRETHRRLVSVLEERNHLCG
jgi:cellulose synthase/poly-beta-1,6-N-acetylglucosamine synthase-like glycosyltransferase